jgi:hypothetical protein
MFELVVTRFDDRVMIDNAFLEIFLKDLPLGKSEEVGHHVTCGSPIELRRISLKYKALICKECNLRAEFHNELEGEDELKQYFQMNFAGV